MIAELEDWKGDKNLVYNASFYESHVRYLVEIK
jgi:hypothetical protein